MRRVRAWASRRLRARPPRSWTRYDYFPSEALTGDDPRIRNDVAIDQPMPRPALRDWRGRGDR